MEGGVGGVTRGEGEEIVKKKKKQEMIGFGPE